MERAIDKAVRIAGGQLALARKITELMPDRDKPVRQGHVYRWVQGTPVSPEVLPAIEEITGITPEELRPDLARIFWRELRRALAHARDTEQAAAG